MPPKDDPETAGLKNELQAIIQTVKVQPPSLLNLLIISVSVGW